MYIFSKYLILTWIVFFAFGSMASSEDLKSSIPDEAIATITDTETSWYAVIKTADKKEKLYAKGDILYPESDITNCLRILKIRKDSLMLEDVNSKETFTISPGERIPLERSEIIFKKTVEAYVIEGKY